MSSQISSIFHQYSVTMFITPSSSSVSILPQPTNLQPSLHSYTTLPSHQRFPPLNISAAPRTEPPPFSLTVSPQPLRRFLIQCSRSSSPPDFQSEPGFLYTLFREIELNDDEIGSVLLRNPVLRTTSLDKIRSRLLSLHSVKIKGISLHRLVTKSPHVLTAEEIDPLLRFLIDELEGKLEPTQLERLLISTEARLLVGFDQKVNLLIHHGIPKDKIPHVLNNINLAKALCIKPVEEIERTFNFLNPYDGIGIIVRRPVILNFDLDTQLIPRVEFLKKLSGGDEDATGMVLRRLPAILSYSVTHVENHVEFFRSFAGLTDSQIFKIFLVFPNVVSASKDRKLYPRVKFLKQCGLDSIDIFKFLSKAPLFLALSFEDNLAHKLGLLVKLGYEYRTKEMAFAMGAVTRTSCDNMQKVIGLFLGYELSYDEIFLMSKKHPQILQYSYGSLKEKLEYLIKDMGREVEELLVFPAFLGYKLDDRIKHRYEVKKMTRGENLSLNKLLTVSAESFSTKKIKDTPVGDLQN